MFCIKMQQRQINANTFCLNLVRQVLLGDISKMTKFACMSLTSYKFLLIAMILSACYFLIFDINK